MNPDLSFPDLFYPPLSLFYYPVLPIPILLLPAPSWLLLSLTCAWSGCGRHPGIHTLLLRASRMDVISQTMLCFWNACSTGTMLPQDWALSSLGPNLYMQMHCRKIITNVHFPYNCTIRFWIFSHNVSHTIAYSKYRMMSLWLDNTKNNLFIYLSLMLMPRRSQQKLNKLHSIIYSTFHKTNQM